MTFTVSGINYLPLAGGTARAGSGNSSAHNALAGLQCVDSATVLGSVTNGSDAYTVTEVADYAFTNCVQLLSVSLPDTIVSIGYDAFQYTRLTYDVFVLPSACQSLAAYCFGSTLIKKLFIGASLSSFLGTHFVSSSFLAEYEVSPLNPHFSSDQQGLLYDKRRTQLVAVPPNLTEISIPRTVTSVGAFAFFGSNLREVVFPESVEEFGENCFFRSATVTSILFTGNIKKIAPLFEATAAPPLQSVVYHGVVPVNTSVFSDLVQPLIFVCEGYNWGTFAGREVNRGGNCFVKLGRCCCTGHSSIRGGFFFVPFLLFSFWPKNRIH
jgi:hypothetical protein